MFKKLNLLAIMLCAGFVVAEELTQNEQKIIEEKTREGSEGFWHRSWKPHFQR